MATPEPRIALERRFPALSGRLPWAPCTTLPTRVHRLARLGDAFGLPGLWIKRDDESGALYGGNKPRKLDFVLGDVLARGKRSVMTFGGIGTNHGLATAIYARHLGLHAILVLVRQPVTAKVRRDLLLYHAYGAELHYGGSVAGTVVRALALCARELARGGLPYIIPTGGTSPLGVVGYVNAACELKEQIDAGLLPAPDWIVLPVGSGGTLAGLALGCRLAGLATRVLGVLVTDILPPSPARVSRQAQRAMALLHRQAPDVPRADVSSADIELITGFVGPSYGTPTPEARAARDALERLEGIHSETTYTAKCLGALHAIAGDTRLRAATVLYWHTYSSVDLTSAAGLLPDYHALPRAFHQFFSGPVVRD